MCDCSCFHLVVQQPGHAQGLKPFNPSREKKALCKIYPYMLVFQGNITEPSIFSCKDRSAYIP